MDQQEENGEFPAGKTLRQKLVLPLSSAACFIGGYLIFPLIVMLIPFPAGCREDIVRIAGGCGPLLALGLLLGVLYCFNGSWRAVAENLDLKAPGLKQSVLLILLSLGIMLFSGMVTLGWQLLAGRLGIMLEVPPTTELMLTGEGWALGLFMLTALLAAPVLEEILFRKVLFQAVAGCCGKYAGALIAALAFGAMHVSLLQLPGLMCMALIWQFVYLRSGNLGCTVLLHLCNNAWALGMLLAARYFDFLNV